MRTKRMAGKAPDFFSVLLADLSTTHYAFIGAVLVGLLGVVFVLWITLRAGSSRSEGRKEKESDCEDEGKKEDGHKQGKQQPKSRAVKTKPSRKLTLPAHPLLAAEFKGHTGPVLSLDFDSNGRYLASCSEGCYNHLLVIKCVYHFILYFSRYRSYHSTLDDENLSR